MKVFIARILIENPFNYKKIREERIFRRYETAFEWLEESFFNVEKYTGYTSEIIEFYLKKTGDNTEQRKINFDHLGNQHPDDPTLNPAMDSEFIPKYSKGDLVQFITFSFTTLKYKNTIGVIAGVPFSGEERSLRFGKSREIDITDQMYTIEYISETGFSEHEHLLERDFQLYQKKLPEEMQFLNRLSLHLTGKQPISREVLEQIYNQKVYLLNIPCIKDFDL